MTRPFVVERRALDGRRFAARPDDQAELRRLIGDLQHVPRESLASMPDLLFFLRRVAKAIGAVVDRLEVVEPRRQVPARSAGQGGRDRAPRRERNRVLVLKSKREVRVVERGSANQIDMGF